MEARRRAARRADRRRGGAARGVAPAASRDVSPPRPANPGEPRPGGGGASRSGARRNAEPGARRRCGRGGGLLEAARRPGRGARGVHAGRAARWGPPGRAAAHPGAADSDQRAARHRALGARGSDAVGAPLAAGRGGPRYPERRPARAPLGRPPARGGSDFARRAGVGRPDLWPRRALRRDRPHVDRADVSHARSRRGPGAWGGRLGAARAPARGLRAVDPGGPLARRAGRSPVGQGDLLRPQGPRRRELARDPRLRPWPRPPRAAGGPGRRARRDVALCGGRSRTRRGPSDAGPEGSSSIGADAGPDGAR